MGILSMEIAAVPGPYHAPDVWSYRMADPGWQGLPLGHSTLGQSGSWLCAAADLVDVKPREILAWLQGGAQLPEDEPSALACIDAVLEQFGATGITCLGTDGGDEERLRQLLSQGFSAVLQLDSDSSGDDACFVAAVGFDAQQQLVLLYCPQGEGFDGWYEWGKVFPFLKGAVTARAAQQSKYSARYIFKQIYGTAVAGHEQRWPDIDLKILKRINKDCIGWIHLDKSPLSYPIVKEHLDSPRYRKCNFSGERSHHGSVHLSGMNLGSLDGRHLIFCAHNMKDCSMFKAITYFEQPKFAEEHPCIDLLLGERHVRAYPFASTVHKGSDMEHMQVQFNNDDELLEWAGRMLAKTTAVFDNRPRSGDQIATFCTCCGTPEDPATFALHTVLCNAAGTHAQYSAVE